MARQKLPPDATVATVLPTLDKAEDYVEKACQNLRDAHKLHPNAVVRLGIMGYGSAPNYRIESGDPPTLMAYDSATHRGFTDVGGTFDKNWSTVSMTFEELNTLLGKMRSRPSR